MGGFGGVLFRALGFFLTGVVRLVSGGKEADEEDTSGAFVEDGAGFVKNRIMECVSGSLGGVPPSFSFVGILTGAVLVSFGKGTMASRMSSVVVSLAENSGFTTSGTFLLSDDLFSLMLECRNSSNLLRVASSGCLSVGLAATGAGCFLDFVCKSLSSGRCGGAVASNSGMGGCNRFLLVVPEVSCRWNGTSVCLTSCRDGGVSV